MSVLPDSGGGINSSGSSGNDPCDQIARLKIARDNGRILWRFLQHPTAGQLRDVRGRVRDKKTGVGQNGTDIAIKREIFRHCGRAEEAEQAGVEGAEHRSLVVSVESALIIPACHPR